MSSSKFLVESFRHVHSGYFTYDEVLRSFENFWEGTLDAVIFKFHSCHSSG